MPPQKNMQRGNWLGNVCAHQVPPQGPHLQKFPLMLVQMWMFLLWKVILADRRAQLCMWCSYLMFSLKLVLIFSQQDWSGPWPREVSTSCSFEHTLFFQNTPTSTLKKMLKIRQGEVCPCCSVLPHAVTGDGTMFSCNRISMNTGDYMLLYVHVFSFSLD